MEMTLEAGQNFHVLLYLATNNHPYILKTRLFSWGWKEFELINTLAPAQKE